MCLVLMFSEHEFNYIDHCGSVFRLDIAPGHLVGCRTQSSGQNDRTLRSLKLGHDKGFSLFDERPAAMLLNRKRSKFVYKKQRLSVSKWFQSLNDDFYLRSIIWIGTCEDLSSSSHRIPGLTKMPTGGPGRDRYPV